MGHYMRNEDALVPPAGRFNFGQKQFFWLMVICGAALLISGIALWFTASIPRGLQVVRYLAVLIHAVAALATIGGIIIHIYMGLAVVPGGLHAILHGDVSEQWARHHHGRWAAQAPRIRTSATHGDRDLESRWDARIARARELALDRPAARDLLTFYAALAEYQRGLAAGARDALTFDVDRAIEAIPDFLAWLRRTGPSDSWRQSSADRLNCSSPGFRLQPRLRAGASA